MLVWDCVTKSLMYHILLIQPSCWHYLWVVPQRKAHQVFTGERLALSAAGVDGEKGIQTNLTFIWQLCLKIQSKCLLWLSISFSSFWNNSRTSAKYPIGQEISVVRMPRAASEQAAAVQSSPHPQAAALFWATVPTPEQVASLLVHPLLGLYSQTTPGFQFFGLILWSNLLLGADLVSCSGVMINVLKIPSLSLCLVLLLLLPAAFSMQTVQTCTQVETFDFDLVWTSASSGFGGLSGSRHNSLEPNTLCLRRCSSSHGSTELLWADL